MKKHFSAGGVLYSPFTKKYYLIRKRTKNKWLFPKGHLEKEESRKQAAIREVKEETGYQALEFLGDKPYLEKTSYSFEEKGEKNSKTVWYFLMQLKSKQFETTEEMKEENLTGAWFEKEEVVAALAYPCDKEVFKEVLKRNKNSETNTLSDRQKQDLPD